MSYDLFYKLQDALQSESRLVPAVELYDFRDDQIYAAVMGRLSEPLPNGEESPFSSQDPGSAHAILVSILVYLQSLIAHEINLIPDYSLIWWLRLHGITMQYAEYPVVAIEFTKDLNAIDQNIEVVIDLGTEIQSVYDFNLFAYTQETATIPAYEKSVIVPARLSRLGELPVLRRDEFTRVPPGMSFIESVIHTAVLSAGKPAEKLDSAVARLRDWLKTGDRIVTDRDSLFYGRLGGAKKVNMIRGRIPGIKSFHRDLRTVAVYPSDMVPAVDLEMRSRRMLDERLNVIPAQIIPLKGTIEVRAVTGVSDNQARALVVNAIVNDLNPPHGRWGDEDFAASLATVIEKQNGIYATRSVNLVHTETGEELRSMTIYPWHLFEIQQGLEIVVSR